MSACCCSSTRVRPRRITSPACLNDAGFDEVY
jgi:hypothetical protein